MTIQLLEPAAVRVTIEAGQHVRNPRVVDALLAAGTRCSIVLPELPDDPARVHEAPT